MGAAHSYSFEIPPAPIPEQVVIETVEADLVVVGAGFSGISAALRAAELGAEVAVIEKTPRWNARGGHIGSVNSKAWRAAGVVNDKRAVVRAWIAVCGNRAKEEIVWLFANHSEEAMDWMLGHIERHGLYPVLNGARYAGETYTEFDGSHTIHGEGRGGIAAAVGSLYEDSVALGVKYHFNTPGCYLEKDAAGCVVSVIGGSSEGYRRFRARKGVLLATGDIHGDQELLEAYCPMFLKVKTSHYAPRGANTGDGHKMGLWAGGVMEDGPLPTIMHPQAYSWLHAFFLFVNTQGRRYMNEDTWLQAKSLNVLKQPGGVDYAYSIFDSDWKSQMIAGMPYSGGLFNDNVGSRYGVAFDGTMEEEFLKTGLERGQIVSADTIEELARLAGLPEEALCASVRRYNALVEPGEDTEFGKRRELLFPIVKPPFYASKFGPAMLAVTGGLHVDARLRVLDAQQSPIEGLYAIGNVAGGLYGVDYPTVILGNSHGRALTWGYLAAQFALEAE